MKFEGPNDIPAIIYEAHYLSPAVQEAQKKAELKNAAIRHAERMAKYAAWVQPEAIAERKERHEREAAESLARLKEILGPREEEPLPDEKDLPPHIRGQSASTIRSWMKNPWEPEVPFGLEAWMPDANKTEPFFGIDRTPPPLNRFNRKIPWWEKLLDWLKR